MLCKLKKGKFVQFNVIYFTFYQIFFFNQRQVCIDKYDKIDCLKKITLHKEWQSHNIQKKVFCTYILETTIPFHTLLSFGRIYKLLLVWALSWAPNNVFLFDKSLLICQLIEFLICRWRYSSVGNEACRRHTKQYQLKSTY